VKFAKPTAKHLVGARSLPRTKTGGYAAKNRKKMRQNN
jgi:hypothetical protein